MLNKIPERLKELRENKGLTLEEVANGINTKKGSVSRWENAKCLPNIESVILLAKFFNETTDYLLGLTDD